tara:strand:+ start:2898 stop:5945 length:3048 start_codon:yes stop_codon:yes gene_type:complete
MALKEMKSNLAIGVGSKQTPQSFQDGHSSVIVTGNKEFTIPPRFQVEKSKFTSISHQSEILTHEFNENWGTKTILEMQTPGLQKYYDRVFNNADRLGARNNDRFGFDEPFIIKGIGDRWGPGNLGSFDGGIIRAGAVTSAARTAADVQRIGKFLLTPRGVGFIAKQHILQGLNAGGPVMRSDMPPVDGSLQKIIGDRLGKNNKLLLEPKQQRFSTGRDVFGSTPPTVNEMKGSDIRSWRESSIVDSLPLTAHYVRHKIPAGSPSVQIVKNVGNFVIDMGGGVLSFMDGIDVAFPHVSLNPSFQAGDILTGAGKAIKSAANGIVDVFPNIYNTAASAGQAIGDTIGGIIRGIDIPKVNLGNLNAFTSLFPDLISLPKVQTPDFSGLKDILGGLANTAASLISSIPVPGVKLPNVSLPKLPNMKLPKLPNISLPDINIGNPFDGILNAVKGIDLNFPKFAGKGGLGLGSFSMPDLSNAFPAIRLGAEISKGSLHFDMVAFDEGKAKFQAGLENLIKLPGALDKSSPKKIGNPGIPDYINNGQPYGEDISEFGSQNWFRKGQKKVIGGQMFANLQGEDAPKLYYTTANIHQAQDSKGSLTNIYSKENNYVKLVVTKDGADSKKIGIGYDDKKKMPYAVQAGFLSGQGYGVEDKNFPLNTEKKAPLNSNIYPKDIPNVVEKAGDQAGKRLQKYQMLSYGQLSEQNRYEDKISKAVIERGLGDSGAPGRTAVDEAGNVIQVDAGGGLKNTLNDHVNLHPYGGTTADAIANDENKDFIPFKFRDMVNGKWIIFRAIIESVSDTSSPEYAEERYIGRPDKVYVYQGATRNVNVTFKVMPKSAQELITLWDKLNYLRGLVYPTVQKNRMISPFFSFTLGDMFDKQPMIFQSLNFAVDNASLWEIKPGLRLPKLINVSADMRVIDKRTPQTTGKHYDLPWLDGDQEFGTFDRDPALAASIRPNRKAHQQLFDSLGIKGVGKKEFDKLVKGDKAIMAQKALIEQLKSEGVSAADIPKAVNIPFPG